jgi:hypothetical protein
LEAVRAFVNADDWDATRQVLQARQALLLRPEVEALFEANIAQARATGDERAVQILKLHLALLRDCQTHGIKAAFARLRVAQLQAAQQAEWPFEVELIARSVMALRGDAADKLAHAQYLDAQAAAGDDADLQALLTAIRTAMFGGDLAQLGEDLSGVYRQAWDAIVAGTLDQPPGQDAD